ncbi:MAG: polysaccharide deacetylase family protein [Pseudobdellovibrio sp.]
MRLLIKLIILSTFFFGCTSLDKSKNLQSARVPQQVIEATAIENDITTSIQNSFLNLMNENSDAARSIRTAKFLDRQLSFFYIAQGLLNSFDSDLDKLYQAKIKGIAATDEDRKKFEKSRYQLRIAWEFSERNLHELVGIYELALIQANDPSAEYYRVSNWIIANISKWLNDSWKKGDQTATIALAQEFDNVNNELKEILKKKNKKVVRIPSFKIYSEASSDVRAKAFQQSLKYAQERKQTYYDSFVGKEWIKYQEDRSGDQQDDMYTWDRQPQALDELYPDAGGFGHVTGNRFPDKIWAITFDDGPHPTHSNEMFSILIQNKIKGNFFWLSKNILLYPELVKQAGDLGFNRGSHSFLHANLPTLNTAQLNHEINAALDVFNEKVGQPATMFRCPYGACGGTGSQIRQMIAKRNALHIAWNVDTLDWQDKNPSSIFDRTKKQIEVLNRGIVLFHDIHPQSVLAFKLLAPYMKAKGYIIKPLPEIITEVRGLNVRHPNAFTSP